MTFAVMVYTTKECWSLVHLHLVMDGNIQYKNPWLPAKKEKMHYKKFGQNLYLSKNWQKH